MTVSMERGLDIIVCIKRGTDASARIEIAPDGLEINKDILWILNPFDEFGIEEALRIRERHGGRVTLLTVGAGNEEFLKKGLAMGADEAVCIKDAQTDSLDGLSTARAASLFLKSIPFDLVICGKHGIDGESGATGPAIAGLLDIPLVSAIKALEIYPQERLLKARREAAGGIEDVEAGLPALVTAARGLNEPRYPSLSGIMKAKKTAIRHVSADELAMGMEWRTIGVARENLRYPPRTRKAVILKGPLAGQAREAARFLREEVKLI